MWRHGSGLSKLGVSLIRAIAAMSDVGKAHDGLDRANFQVALDRLRELERGSKYDTVAKTYLFFALSHS